MKGVKRMARKLSKEGLELIKSFEGFRGTAYKCDPSEKYLTIGYGHYGADVKEGDTITKTDALKLLKKDVKRFVDDVNTYQKKYHFNQNQFDALVSFAYNIGSIRQLTANGTRSIVEIANHIRLYDKCGGKTLRGLTFRRQKEYELFIKA